MNKEGKDSVIRPGNCLTSLSRTSRGPWISRRGRNSGKW